MTPHTFTDQDFYTFLEQSGSHFIKENGENQKVRSISSDFLIVIENCCYIENRLRTNFDILSFSGTHSFQRYTTESDSAAGYLHQHDYFELMFVINGIVPVLIEDTMYQYQTDDICLINRSVRHVEQFNSDCSVAFICLPRDLIPGLVSELSVDGDSSLCTFFRQNQKKGAEHQKNFIEFRRSRQHHEQETYSPRSLLQQMMRELNIHYPGYVNIINGLLLRFLYSISKSEEYDSRICHLEYTQDEYIFEQINAYISRTGGVIHRGEIGRELHYSADYLNKIVKQHTGMTLIEYGQTFRMKEAAKLICSTDESIEKISQKLRFENKAYFYRLFEKTYHMSPVAYRKYRRNEHPFFPEDHTK